MQLVQSLFDFPSVYIALQRFVAPEKEEHLRQVLKDQRPSAGAPARILDLGCGPGTNAGLFSCPENYHYVGIDSNPTYVKAATKIYGLDFRCGDITSLQDLPHDYDIALLNSVLHHLDDAQAEAAISTAASHLKPRGKLVVLDSVLPRTQSMSTMIQWSLVHLDRGDYWRDAQVLYDLLARHFSRIQKSSFVTSFLGIRLWDWELYVCHELASRHKKSEKPD